MLTQRELQLFYSVLKFSCSAYVMPYDCLYSTTKLELNFCPTRSVLKRYFCMARRVFSVFYTAFNLARVAQIAITFSKSNSKEPLPVENLAIGLFFVVIRYVQQLVATTVVKCTDEFSDLVNRQNALNLRMGLEIIGKTLLQPNKIRENILQSFIIGFWNYVPVITLVMILQLDKPWFLYSIFPDSNQTPIVFAISILFEAWVIFLTGSGILCTLIVIYSYLVSTNFWIAQLRKYARADQSTEIRVKKLQTCLKYYQSLRLQNNLFNEVFASNFSRGYMLLLIVCFTSTAYCSVRLSSTLDFTTYIMFPGLAASVAVIILIVTGITGRIHDRSWAMVNIDFNRILNSSGQLHRSQKKIRHIIELQLLCCPSLKVRIGDLYFMKISTKLTVLALLINSTVYFLLTV